jgi:hypothetical protein
LVQTGGREHDDKETTARLMPTFVTEDLKNSQDYAKATADCTSMSLPLEEARGIDLLAQLSVDTDYLENLSCDGPGLSFFAVFTNPIPPGVDTLPGPTMRR